MFGLGWLGFGLGIVGVSMELMDMWILSNPIFVCLSVGVSGASCSMEERLCINTMSSS